MTVESLPDPTKQQNREEQVAEAIMLGIRDTAAHIRQRYLQTLQLLWEQDGWDVAAVNRVLRRLDAQMPGYSVLAFQMHAKLGELLALVEPQTVVPGSPVAYDPAQAAAGQIVLDETANYPGAV